VMEELSSVVVGKEEEEEEGEGAEGEERRDL
jgi:hypothetical protein